MARSPAPLAAALVGPVPVYGGPVCVGSAAKATLAGGGAGADPLDSRSAPVAGPVVYRRQLPGNDRL